MSRYTLAMSRTPAGAWRVLGHRDGHCVWERHYQEKPSEDTQAAILQAIEAGEEERITR